MTQYVQARSINEAPSTNMVGRDLLPIGRLIRLLVGLLLLTGGIATAVHKDASGVAIATFAAAVAGYTLLVSAIGQQVLTRIDGWLSAILLVAPAAIISTLPSMSDGVDVGFTIYFAVGMLVQVFIRYGGCEVAGIPTLILRRRYRVYCIYNTVDVVERAMPHRSTWLKTLAAVLALAAVAGAFLLVGSIGPDWLGNYTVLYLLFLLVGAAVNRYTNASGRRGRGQQ